MEKIRVLGIQGPLAGDQQVGMAETIDSDVEEELLKMRLEQLEPSFEDTLKAYAVNMEFLNIFKPQSEKQDETIM